MWDDYAAAFQSDLGPRETLLWSGRPQQGLYLRGADVFLVPFSLLWGGFAIFWESMMIATQAPFFLQLWGLPFVAVGLYFIFGRFLVDAMQRGRTYYGITNERIIINSGLFKRTVKSLDLRTVSNISMTQSGDGKGTISFGSRPVLSWLAHSGWPGMRSQMPSQFELIPDVKTVYEIVRRAQQNALSPLKQAGLNGS